MFDNNNQPRGLIFDLISKVDYLKVNPDQV